MKNSTDVRTLKNLSKSCRYTIPEVKGLHLWVRPNRQKYWVFRYTFNGKRFDYGIGSFNDVPLAEAKKSAQKLRGSILHGINPLEAKKTLMLDLIKSPDLFGGRPQSHFPQSIFLHLNFQFSYKKSSFGPN